MEHKTFKVSYKFSDGTTITQENVVMMWSYPDGLKTDYPFIYLSFKCWSDSLNRYYYPAVYNKPISIMVEI